MPHCDGYQATRLIRKHPDPAIRNILIIAMTASAIQGDREKCLDSGMNNYLAKPVRAQTLKALLESYLSKEANEEEIPNLQNEAKRIVKEALETADGEEENEGETERSGPTKKAMEEVQKEEMKRPPSVRTITAQRIPHDDGESTNTNGLADPSS